MLLLRRQCQLHHFASSAVFEGESEKKPRGQDVSFSVRKNDCLLYSASTLISSIYHYHRDSRFLFFPPSEIGESKKLIRKPENENRRSVAFTHEAMGY